MNRGDLAWAALLAAGIAFEVHELHQGPNGVPLTHTIRRTFRTSTPAGRWAFRAAVWIGADVLVRHITTQPTGK